MRKRKVLISIHNEHCGEVEYMCMYVYVLTRELSLGVKSKNRDGSVLDSCNVVYFQKFQFSVQM